MNKLIVLALLLAAGAANAQTVIIKNEELGSGTPNSGFPEIQHQYNAVADKWDPREGIFHAPQYMPGYPTAATIFPRVLDVECVSNGKTSIDDLMHDRNAVHCIGYHWSPEMGRAEYLFIRPHVVTPPAPVVVEKIVEKPVERIVLKEVPPKKNGE